MIIWVINIFLFIYLFIYLYSSVYSFHLDLISSASIRSLPFLSFIMPILGWNIPLIFPVFLNRSLVLPFLLFFLYFFACSLLLLFSHPVVSDSLQPHELQHARPPCLSPTPGVCPNPCPLSRWYHPSISSSFVPFSSCSQSFPASGSSQMSQLFALVPLHFLPLERYHPHIWVCWCFSHLSWFQLVTHPAWHFLWCAQHIG